MKRNRILLAGALAGAIAATPVAALTADNPYVGTITNRNLFLLKPPPDPNAPENQPSKPPLPNVKLSGITTLLGKKLAVLRVPRVAKPPEPAKEVSVMLGEGAPAEEGVRVLEINVGAGTVKIVNGDTEQLLDIAKDAPKGGPAPAAPGTLPVPPPRPGGLIPAPAAAPAAPPAVTSFGRPVRGSGQADATASAAPGSGAMPSVAQPAQQEQVPAEVAAITYASWAIRDKPLVDAGQMPPYPPNVVTEMIDEEEQGGNQTPPPGPPGF